MKKGMWAVGVAVSVAFSLFGASSAWADEVFDVSFPRVGLANISSAPISGTCDTDGLGISITVTDGSVTTSEVNTACAPDLTWSAALDVSTLADGTITASIVIGESAPTTENTPKDTTPPQLSVYVGDGFFSIATSAEGYIFDTQDPLFEFNQDDGDNIVTLSCAMDGGSATDCLSDFFYQAAGLTDGPHVLTLTAINDFDDSGDITTNFCVNTCEEGSGGGSGGGEETPVETVQLAIRDGATLIGPFTLELPASTTPDVAIAPTGTTTTYTVPARSVLALLYALDASSTDFAITDLAYYPAFESFIINCVSVPAASDTDDCYSWTYAVDGSFPSVGMDVTELSDGDVAYVFFGSAWQVSVSDTEVDENESFTATIEKYDAETGTYVPAEGEIAGAVQFDDFFVPTEFATSTTDAEGHATLAVAQAGEYAVGAQIVSYYPYVTVTVSAPVEEGSSGGGGGGGGGVSHLTFNVPAALAYLSNKQNADGSFSSSLLSDWAAIAFAAADPGEAKTKLRAHLISANPSLSGVQDYIRHAMALMALGIDPYKDAGMDYITPIVQSYDGTQIGDASLDNDDIFALFPLSHAGYNVNDTMIKNVVAFIVSKQQSNGSWTGGADMTAAAIQALTPFGSLPGVADSLVKARAYLHTQQENNGGFGSSSATSWSMQAIAAFGESETSWTAGGLYPRDYLASLQQSDGGVELTSASDLTRIWATEYAIPAATGATWNSLLSSFSKPTSGVTGGGTTSTTATSTATTTAATSTLSIAPTSTATSTTPTAAEIANEIDGIARVLAAIGQQTPAQAYEERIAAIDDLPQNEPTATTTQTEEPQTESEALEQVAAAAAVGDIDWRLIILALLALILFGITGYITFVRKYWR